MQRRPGHTWEETCLGDTKQDPADHKTSEVLNDAGESHDDTPGNNKQGDIGRRPLEPSKENIAGDFEQNVGDEENAQPVL